MNSNASGGDDVQRRRDEEINMQSDSENSIETQPPKRKRYHRHTLQQIQHMEAFFKECPHPDDAQRKELSRELGLEPLQIKFWFQNKRTQMKTQHEHDENARLRAENEKLRAENLRYKEVLSNVSCLNCRGPTQIPEMPFHEQQLVLENARLRKEIDQISCVTAKCLGKPVVNSTENASSSARHLSEKCTVNNESVIETVREAAEELLRVAQLGEPLWVPSVDRNTCVLNEEEYLRSFSRVFGPKQNGFKSEATRESAIVPMDTANVVDILMDLEKWSSVFSGVVASATSLQVISPGVDGSYNGATIVMCAEFQVPSPLVPTRESYLLRHAKHHVDGTWIVVDVSLHHLQYSAPFRRRPSGCLIQDMPNAYSKVTWVENVDVEEGGIHHIYKPLVTAGIAFGAKRWIAILSGYCQRLLATNDVSPPVTPINYLANSDGKRNLMKLAEDMVTMFCRGVNTSVSNRWTTLSANGNDNVKVMTRKNMDDPKMPFGIHLIVATSFWLPVPPKRVFDFLRDENNRKEWEMQSSEAEFHEILHIVTGEDAGNSVAIYQDVNYREGEMILLQESRIDPTASYVVYAPIGMVCLNAILSGGDPSYVPLLPSGFVILPDGPTGGQGRGMASQVDSGGSLLTVALQVLVDSSPNAKLSLESVSMTNKLINCTVDNILKAFVPKNS